MFEPQSTSISRFWPLLIAIVLVIGAGLRLVWPGDMEYKGDEIYSFERTQRVGVSESFPWTGMSNSADVPHPGMSVWVFLGLAKLTGATSPEDLNIACMGLNVLALFLLVGFVAWVVPAHEREPWWWAVALVSVNPLAVVFHRKIWPPSVMPCITVLLLTAWWHRDRRVGAFAFGLLAIIAAQIHPGAFFFTAGMALWAMAFHRTSVRWLSGIAGTVVGSVPAWPWLYHLFFVAERSAWAKARWFHPLEMKFWTYWFTEPFGFNLEYSLGKDFGDFLRWPLIDGRPTFVVAALHVALALALIAIVGRAARRCWQERNFSIGTGPTAFTLAAVAGGYGLSLTLTGLPVYRHYMIITFPLMFVWLARCAFVAHGPLVARRWLAGTCTAQCLLSVFFLMYIHEHDRPIRGDYGTPLRVQKMIHRHVASRP